MPAQPLSPDELEDLQSTLVQHMEHAGCMPLDVAHGFLTATAAAPVGGDPAPVLGERVLGGLAADPALRDLVARFRQQVLRDLGAGDYGPLILQLPRDDGEPLPLPYGWCQGYVAGLEFLGEDQRDRLLADEQAGGMLTPVLSFLMYEQDQWLDPPDEAAHREIAAQLADAALGLYRWWLARC
jgi:yecA family protein